MRRLFDLFWSCVGLCLLWPLFIFIAVLIKLGDGGPVFFRQERVGYKGCLFRIWKFRTMVVGADRKGGSLTVAGDSRITRVGKALRGLKFDELPQLLNVLVGDMRLVGPRPEVPKYVALYNADQRAVLDLLPGITDPASIKFRHENELLVRSPDPEATYVREIMPEKIKLNLEYEKRASVWSDFLVVLKTLATMWA